ncbi:hypothetical protein HHI36_004470, partial [Cryptolaemus montrouzieri]
RRIQMRQEFYHSPNESYEVITTKTFDAEGDNEPPITRMGCIPCTTDTGERWLTISRCQQCECQFAISTRICVNICVECKIVFLSTSSRG